MSLAIAMDARTEAFEELRSTIKGVVGRFCQRTHSDFEEMLSLAHVTFLQAFETFDNSRGMAFASYVVQKVNFSLMEFQREAARRRGLHQARFGSRIDEDADSCSDRRNQFFLPELLDELSEDGRAVVRLTLHSREVRHALMDQTHYTNDSTNTAIRHGTRTALREVLDELGWSATRITESFKEIAQALST